MTYTVLSHLLAFLLGVVCTMQTGLWKNGRQIRRNAETIRLNSEAARDRYTRRH